MILGIIHVGLHGFPPLYRPCDTLIVFVISRIVKNGASQTEQKMRKNQSFYILHLIPLTHSFLFEIVEVTADLVAN